MKKLNCVIDLFGGMATGAEALKQLGVTVKHHLYSDIKKAAIKVTNHKHPEIKMLGRVENISYKDGVITSEKGTFKVGKVDLITSGSPCKDLSIAGKRQGINGKSSKLFFEFARILNEIRAENPNVMFFQENVGSAPKRDQIIMSNHLGVLPQRYNSIGIAPVSRDRLYWSNIKTKTDWTGYIWTNFYLPEKTDITLSDILEKGFVFRNKGFAILEAESRVHRTSDKLIHRYEKGFNNGVFEKIVQVNPAKEFGNRPRSQNLIYADYGKSGALAETTAKRVRIAIKNNTGQYIIRPFTQIELCRAHGFDDNYCEVLTRDQTASVVGDGWELRTIKHFFSQINFNKNED